MTTSIIKGLATAIGYYLLFEALVNRSGGSIGAPYTSSGPGGPSAPTPPPYGGRQGLPGSYASGGAFITKQPTTILVGEAGPEYVSITPLSKMTTPEMMTNSSGGGYGGGSLAAPGGGKLTVELFLSKDLEYRIVDQTLSEAADVFLDVMRNKR